MRTTRIVIGTIGVVVGAFGAWLLLTRQDLDQLVDAAVWLAGGSDPPRRRARGRDAR